MGKSGGEMTEGGRENRRGRRKKEKREMYRKELYDL